MKNLLLFSFLASLFLINSCTYNEKKKDEELATEVKFCDTANYNFGTVILPILNKNCTSVGCHNAGSSFGGLTNYNEVKALESKFQLKVFSASATMPLGKAWSSETDKQKFKCWLDNGAKND